ncbi:MAG: hypothetical protein ACRCTS_03000 [Fusobacteriaceae bacterium]
METAIEKIIITIATEGNDKFIQKNYKMYVIDNKNRKVEIIKK